MDFETRQKQAVEEINVVLEKYGVALQPFLNAQATGIIPAVRLIDTVKEAEVILDAKHEEKPKKGKK